MVNSRLHASTAIYTTDSFNSVELDTSFCDGTTNEPKPKNELDNMVFGITLGDDSSAEYHDCSVRKWIESIQNGEEPDQLTKLDALIDKSIGGRGTTVEYVIGTTREVPLIEFRRLPAITKDNIPSFVRDAEQEIVNYHHQYRGSSKILRREQKSR